MNLIFTQKTHPKFIHQDLIVTEILSDATKITTCQIGCQQKSSRQNWQVPGPVGWALLVKKTLNSKGLQQV